MRICVLGPSLPAKTRSALGSAGMKIVPAGRADLRLVIATRPPSRPPKAPWLWISPKKIDPADAAQAVLAGAYDVVQIDDDLPLTIQRRIAELSVRAEPTSEPAGFVAKSPAARRILDELDRAARTSMAVLLTGETGTGKDLAARHIHARSGRKGELVPINCAAVPNELIEGELFGHVRGAFSGAIADYAGIIHAATG